MTFGFVYLRVPRAFERHRFQWFAQSSLVQIQISAEPL